MTEKRKRPEVRETDSPEAHERIDHHVKNDAKRWIYLAWSIIMAYVLIGAVSMAFLFLLGQVRDNTDDAASAAHQANVAAAKANETARRVNSVAAATNLAARHSTVALCFEVAYLDNVIKQTKNLIRLDSDPARRKTRVKQLALTKGLLGQMRTAVGDDCPNPKKP